MKQKKVKFTSLKVLEYVSVVPAIENTGLMYITIASNRTDIEMSNVFITYCSIS